MSFQRNVKRFRIFISMSFLLSSPWAESTYIENIGESVTELQKRADRADQSVLFFLTGANFYRFNAKNWQFTVYFAVITQKLWQFSVYFVVIYAFFWC